MSAATDAGLSPGDKCPMSGQVISFTPDEWIGGEAGVCHYCGGMTRLRVRGPDLSPWARALAHRVPK